MDNKFSKPLLIHARDCIAILSDMGLTLKVGSDFDHFKHETRKQPERHHINPAFDAAHCDLNLSDSFWMLGYNAHGELVLTQAIKLLPLAGRSLQSFLEDQVWDFRSYGYDFDPARTQFQLTSQAAQMSGRVTYHGELWLKGGDGGIRGGCGVILLTRLMMILAILRWCPDFMIGLQSPTTSCRGLAVREGYLRSEQRSILWYQRNSDIPMEDWMVWMSKEEAEFNLRIPPQYFYDVFEKRNPESIISAKRA